MEKFPKINKRTPMFIPESRVVKLPQDTIVVNKTGFNQALSAYPLEQSYKALHKNYQIFLFSRHPVLKIKKKNFI